jgi:TolB protein
MRKLQCVCAAAIFVVSVQCGSASAPDGSPPKVITPPDSNPPEIISPSGRIAFVTEVSAFNGALYIANSDGTGLRQLSSGQAYCTRPRWSPDRRRIAFGKDTDDLTSGIYVIDVDGTSGIRRLGDGGDPAWSPDGKKIAFVSQGGGGFGATGIYVMNADGTGVQQLTSPNNPIQCPEGASANDNSPDWSPDGKRILFERDLSTDDLGGYDCNLDGYGRQPQVFVMNADGTGLRRLRSVASDVSDQSPSWSPDGRLVAYNSYMGGGLFLIDSAGASAAQPVPAQSNGLALDPVWSPDGKKLLFLDGKPPTNALAIYELATGITTHLSFPTVAGLILDPAWSR